MLFTTAQRRKQPPRVHRRVEGQMGEQNVICVIAYDGILFRLNRTGALTCAVTWTDLEDIVPREIRTQNTI